jgi:DNA-binding MarR family transcriptional regulator
MVIRAIREMDKPTVTAIARTVSLSQATVTTILNRLESKGLLTRQRDKIDRRAVNLRLTKAGNTMWKDAPEPLQYSFTERFSILASWEQHAIVATLERVATMMDAQTLDAAPLLTPGVDVK